jgi:hypothetical protein
MADNIKGDKAEVEETTNQTAPTDEKNKGVETTDEKSDSTAPEGEDNKADESEIDYKAELKRITEAKQVSDNRLLKAENKIVQLKKGLKSVDDSNDEEDIVDISSEEDDSYGVKEIVRSEVERITSSIRENMLGDVISEELDSLSKLPEERELIKYHYDNTIRPSGTNRNAIREDLRNAYLLANQKKFIKETEELRVAVKAAATKSKGDSGSNQNPLKSKELAVKLSAADIAFCKKRGIDPNKIKYEIQ